MAVNGTSRIKRPRRTKAEMGAFREAVYEIVERIKPCTVRQVFYQSVNAGLVPKEETRGYDPVQRALVHLRREGVMPYEWISDETRWMRKPRTHHGLERMLRETARTYRRALWDEQDAYVEIWLEKEALAGVVDDVTAEWDVPLMVTKGFPSLTYLHGAAKQLEAEEKPVFLYYFGDWDPSGKDISRVTEERLREMVDEDFHFRRVAINEDDILHYSLQTRPTKATDSRAAKFKGESVELDALPPDTLRDLVRQVIEFHVDEDALERTRAVEKAERETLREIAQSWGAL